MICPKVTKDGVPQTEPRLRLQQEKTKEPTGFIDPGDVIVTGDSSNRTVTLTGTVEAYYRGVQNADLISGYTSPAHGTDTTTQYFLVYDGSTIRWVDLSAEALDFSYILIALAFYDATNTTWVYLRECHGLMPWQDHEELHEVVGTYKKSGGTLADYVLASTTAAERRPSVSVSIIKDEDNPTTILALAAEGNYTQYYIDGADGDANFALTPTDIVPLSGSQPYWNEFTGGVWQQTLLATTEYMAVWVVQIPVTSDAGSQAYRTIFAQGQQASSVLANIQALEPKDYNAGELDDLSPESIFIAKVIIRYIGGDWQLIEVNALTGSRLSQASSPTGNYLSSVATDATITGIGTTGDPLSVVQSYLIAAGLSGGQSAYGGTATGEKLCMFDNTADLTQLCLDYTSGNGNARITGKGNVGLSLASETTDNYANYSLIRGDIDGTFDIGGFWASAGAAGNFSTIATKGDQILTSWSGDMIYSARGAGYAHYWTSGNPDSLIMGLDGSGNLDLVTGNLYFKTDANVFMRKTTTSSITGGAYDSLEANATNIELFSDGLINIRKEGTKSIGFYSDSTIIGQINSSENWGIGGAPEGTACKMHVKGGANGLAFKASGSNPDGVRASIFPDDADGYAAFYAYDENDGGTGAYVEAWFGHGATKSNALVADGAGNFGLGVTPGEQLQFSTSGNAYFRNGGILWDNDDPVQAKGIKVEPNPDGGIRVVLVTSQTTGKPILTVESTGGSERLRVEHDGLTSTTNTFKAAGYQSSDGTAGATGTITLASISTITVKNGLITAYS